jgi:hypothetical protein
LATGLQGGAQLGNFGSKLINDLLQIRLTIGSCATGSTSGLRRAGGSGFGPLNHLLGKLSQTLSLLSIKFPDLA